MLNVRRLCVVVDSLIPTEAEQGQSNLREIQKYILEIEKKKFCHVLLVPAVSQRHTGVFPPFPASKMAKERGSKHRVRCSVINVEENLGTIKHSAVGVKH